MFKVSLQFADDASAIVFLTNSLQSALVSKAEIERPVKEPSVKPEKVEKRKYKDGRRTGEKMKRWTAVEDDTLAAMFTELSTTGKDPTKIYAEIAKRMGRSKRAVGIRLSRMKTASRVKAEGPIETAPVSPENQ